MKNSARPKGPSGVPMPLWLQGLFEFLQAAVLSALVVIIPLTAVWLADGFAERSFDSLARLAGQIWLLMHGVPLHLTLPAGTSSADTISGVLSLIPLGLTVVPFLLAWRGGRRLARASYTDQLWQAMLGALGTYAAAGLVTAYTTATPEVGMSLTSAGLIPLIPTGLGLVIGARREAGSWGRLVGVDVAAWISRTSQHSRWAGSYVGSVLRAGLLAFAAAFGLAAILLSVDLGLHWAEIVPIYEQLNVGIAGGVALTLLQIGLIPNLAVWSLAWAAGPGFAIGTGSTISPVATTVGPLPALPILGALPTGQLDYGLLALLIPVAAGALAGWWFVRDGENHFDEWLSIRVKKRWFTLSLSTLLLAVCVGLTAGVLSLVAAWLSRGSVGVGRLVDVGPDPLITGTWLAIDVAVGVVLGHFAGLWLERERPAKPRR